MQRQQLAPAEQKAQEVIQELQRIINDLQGGLSNDKILVVLYRRGTKVIQLNRAARRGPLLAFIGRTLKDHPVSVVCAPESLELEFLILPRRPSTPEEHLYRATVFRVAAE